jgi:hypothetical protein
VHRRTFIFPRQIPNARRIVLPFRTLAYQDESVEDKSVNRGTAYALITQTYHRCLANFSTQRYDLVRLNQPRQPERQLSPPGNLGAKKTSEMSLGRIPAPLLTRKNLSFMILPTSFAKDIRKHDRSVVDTVEVTLTAQSPYRT